MKNLTRAPLVSKSLMRLLPLALLALSIAAAPPQERLDPLEPALRRAASDRDILLRLAPGAASPRVDGLTPRGRVGDVLSARATPAALAALAARGDVLRVEEARPMHLLNDISHATTIGFRGTISAAAEIDAYLFAATAGQTVRVRVHAEAALDPLLTVTDAAPVIDDNSGPGSDGELTITFATAGAKNIDVTEVGGTTGPYLLTITSSTAITPAALTGGDIGLSLPHVGGTRAREARTFESVDGSGVVVGVIDTGIDFTHGDFRETAGNTRLLSIWDQTLTPIAGEISPDVGADGSTTNDYGVVYSQAQIDSTLSGATPGFVRQKDTDGHGTHVAGTAAGDGSSSVAGYVGAAPAARLIVIKYNGLSSGIIDGLAFILKTADDLGYKGLVVNLSVGTHDGPHDGTSALDAAIDASVKRGRYVVVAAGNEGATRVHARQTIPAAYTFSFTPSSSAPSGGTPHAVDFWADGLDGYTVTVTDPTFGDTATATSGSSASVGPTALLQMIQIDNKVDSPSNGATHIRVQINNSLPAIAWTIAFTRTATAGNGVVDGWAGTPTGLFDLLDIAPNADGSIPGTVGEPATAKKAITVGAFRGKFSWDNTTPGTTVKGDGIGVDIAGNLAGFSSRGPTRDGRQKPDISAPGAYVASSRSVDATFAAADSDADGVHAYFSGTSMASPHVAGLLALFLQKNKLIDVETVKSTLAANAQLDGFTVAGSSWGAGKVDAVTLLASVPIQIDVEADSGTCLGSTAGPAGGLFWLALLLFPLVRRIR
jgi:subtilisin family serine protease